MYAMTSHLQTRIPSRPRLGCDRLVMAAPVISILSDSSEQSVGSHAPRVILFGAIPVIIPVIPETVSNSYMDTGEAIPFDRPYRTHLNWPRKLLTARKRVRPFPARRLAWRRASHRSSDHYSSPDFTSDFIFFWTMTQKVDHLTWVYLLVLTPRYSEALDSGGLSLPRLNDDLLPPHKRFRDSHSPEDSREEHMKIGIADAETVADLGISDGVVAHTKDGISMGVEIAASDIREDEEEFEA
ncbi:hypothetical protein Tco_0531363 [Tanacetum coccineum]